MKRIFITDFDGTITLKDTCDAMIERFAGEGWQEILKKWEQGELSTSVCSRSIFKTFQVAPEDLKAFIATIPFDKSFVTFCEYLQKKGEKLFIVSDGFDLNITTILEKYSLTNLPVYCNNLLYNQGSWDLSCPYSSECGQCGTCKKALVSKLKKTCDQIVYIGDGYSDTCGCQGADIIFAKSHLLEYCRSHQIKAYPFTTFADIIAWLEQQ